MVGEKSAEMKLRTCAYGPERVSVSKKKDDEGDPWAVTVNKYIGAKVVSITNTTKEGGRSHVMIVCDDNGAIFYRGANDEKIFIRQAVQS